MLHLSNSPEFQAVHVALSEGHYEQAFSMLEDVAQGLDNRQKLAELKLYQAAIFALYGAEGCEGGQRCLNEASLIDPSVVPQPLYRALFWEFEAYISNSVTDVKRASLAAARVGSAFVMYHAANALAIVGACAEAVSVLETLNDSALPEYLQWRCDALLGRCFEQLLKPIRAIEAYKRSSQRATGLDQQRQWLSLASCLLETEQSQETLEVLGNIDDTVIPNVAERAVKYYIEGCAFQQLGEMQRGLESFINASDLEASVGQVSFNLQLALAQSHASLTMLSWSLKYYRAAVELAPTKQRAFVQHELAYTLFEAEQLHEAKDILLQVLEDKDYPHRADVIADLADIAFRQGDLREAEELAYKALDLGADISASLCLANVAQEYFLLDEALVWYERVLSACQQGDVEWLTAKQMLADILAQQGFSEPERIILHAKDALRYIHKGEEWHLILSNYIERATALLSGYNKLLN